MVTPGAALAVGITVLVVALQFRTRRVRAVAYLWVVLLIAPGRTMPIWRASDGAVYRRGNGTTCCCGSPPSPSSSA